MDEHPLVTNRDTALARLADGTFDVLIVGGGIIGAAIAAEAARAGLDVALVERGDFGGATSSASSKLIHGGLRYLRLGDVALVRQAHTERRRLTQVVAPHLVRRVPFLLPLYRDGPYGPLTIQAALVLYSALARSRLHPLASRQRARGLVPQLRTERLRSCAIYADAVTHDGRLCLANIRAAADAGATVVNHAEAKALRIVGGHVTGAEVACFDGSLVEVSARTVVNATGPWVDELRRLEDPAAAPTVRLSKGVHVLLALDEPWAAAVTVPQDAVRVSFAIPWQGMLLLGTTDTPHEGPPSEIGAGEADIAQVLAEAAIAVEPGLLRPQAVKSTFAGLRVLPLGDGETATARRETVFHRGGRGMLTVAGGKLTTYRHIALTALSLLRADLGLHRIETRPVPLPGAADPDLVARALNRAWPQLDAATASHLAGLYGNRAREVLAPAVGDPELLRPLHPAGPDIVAQAVYARNHEWAQIPDDILRRRTTIAARGLADAATVARVERLLERHPANMADSSRTGDAAGTAPFRL